jgi:ribosomal protein S6--L-glutamate ligase
MILSFHPCFVGDENILCAGRQPDDKDLRAIKQASAVILPQGCPESLYKMARKNSKNIFPDYDARFAYPGKIGQIELFKKSKINYPVTECFNNLQDFRNKFDRGFSKLPLQLPFVFKFNWGGEGETVFLVKSSEQFSYLQQKAAEYEKTGQSKFMLQEFVPSRNRTLRVVVIGRKIISYWRVQKNKDTFCTSITKGAHIDHCSDPDLQRAACVKAKRFCKDTGINLAGFDFLFSEEHTGATPFFLEINYFFGREGLGGSDNYYKILIKEIKKWLNSIGME